MEGTECKESTLTLLRVSEGVGQEEEKEGRKERRRKREASGLAASYARRAKKGT